MPPQTDIGGAPAEKPERTLRGVISGDLTSALAQRGMATEGPRQDVGAVSWRCVRRDSEVEYRAEFTGQSPTRLQYVTTTVMQPGTLRRDRGVDLLAFIASLPYQGSDPPRAQRWCGSMRARTSPKPGLAM